MESSPKKKRGGVVTPGPGKRLGRPPLPEYARKKNLMLRVDPILHEWLTALPKGETERILQRAHTASLIV